MTDQAAVTKITGYIQTYLKIIDKGGVLTDHQAKALATDLRTLVDLVTPESTAVEWSKLSEDPSYAIQQLIALAGVEDTDPSDNANIDSDALNAAVADRQDIRDALVVLGTLPRSASPAVFDTYFDVTPVPGSQDGSENIQPKAEFDRTGVWAAYRASKIGA